MNSPLEASRHRRPCTEKKRNELIEQNLPLVEIIARGMLRHMLPCFEYDDIHQQGCLGLIDAASKYQPKFRVPFRLYAKWRIRGAILDSIRRRHSKNATHLPLTPDVFELPGAGPDRLERQVELTELRAIIARSRACLTAAEQKALEIYYDRDEQLTGVGQHFGVKQSQSSHIVRMARKSLQRELQYRNVRAA